MTRPTAALLASAALAALCAPHAALAKDKPQSLLYFPEGNRLHRVDIDTIGDAKAPPLEDVPIQNASDEGGVSDELLFVSPNRDVNGMICEFPDGSGRFVMGEDTRQITPPPGWGVFERSGDQIGKLTATYAPVQGEPFGCAFAPDPDPDDNVLPPLFTTEVGTEDAGAHDGQLILWFPPYDRFPPAELPAQEGDPEIPYPDSNQPSTNFCKIATDIATASGIAIDAQGRVYVASPGAFRIRRFSPPFPTAPNAAGGCGGTELGSPKADVVNDEVFVQAPITDLTTFSGLAIGPNGHLFAASVATGRILEYDLDGNLVRKVVDPPEPPFTFPSSTGNPQGIAFDSEGTLYYADLELEGVFPNVGPGDDGKVWRVRFDKKGNPLPPEVVKSGLAFPDSVSVFPGDLERKKAGGTGKTEWRDFAGGPLRQFMNAKESKLKKSTVKKLKERWRFRTAAVITGSPSVAAVELPEGRTQIVYFTSWDNNLYALRLSDGSKLWHFTGDVQPGASYPATSSTAVAEIDGRDVVIASIGETLYALDAVTGDEIWRFAAGTGCRDDMGVPPGLCGFASERNEIETSPIVADGKVFFGMDVNDQEVGKGGFYAVNAEDGRLAFFFDLESGSTCRPDAGDDVRRFDGYHSESELGLPPGFLATRSGCAFDRTPTGCGNVWSSPAVDAGRAMVFFGSSNCDTDNLPGTNKPAPPMPPHDEALTALHFDGTVAWRWRPREVDNDDLAFGATPNLFAIKLGKKKVDVVGLGGKDGSYYVIDRDGVNETTGQGFDAGDPLALPYWHVNLVQGGVQGGVIGTPAVDEKARRLYIATAQGNADPDVLPSEQPVVRALDLDDGTVLWERGSNAAPEDGAFGPVSATKDLVFVGAIRSPTLRILDAKNGEILAKPLIGDLILGSAIASGAVVVDGTVLVGTGIGTFTGNPSDFADIVGHFDSSLVALCVPGSKGCPK